MFKSIFLLLVTVFLLTGCHRYNHNIHASIIPQIVIQPNLFSGYYYNNRGYNRSYNGHYRSNRGHHNSHRGNRGHRRHR